MILTGSRVELRRSIAILTRLNREGAEMVQSSDLEYTRGYVLAPGRHVAAPSRFADLGLPGGHVFSHDHNLPATLARQGSAFVLLAGYAIDLSTGADDLSASAWRLLSDLMAGEQVFFERVDQLAGRHVIVYSDGVRLFAMTDATGMKSIFYRVDQPGMIASHASMLSNGPADQRLAFRFGFPGLRTPYDGVRILTANTALDLSGNTVVRFYPRQPLPTLSVEQAAQEIERLVALQMPAISRCFDRKIMSITAGIDSRAILAILRQRWPEIEFFTYTSSAPDQQIDAAVAVQIARRCNLNHKCLDYDGIRSSPSIHKEFTESCNGNMYERSSMALHYCYWKWFANGHNVHIRGNLAEIGRCFWRKWHKDTARELPYTRMADLYCSNLKTRPGQSDYDEIVGLFTEMGEITASSRRRLGRDPYDVFYWEHRMSQWHGQVCIEGDPAFETHAPLNARCILDAMLSVPRKARLSSAIFKSIIDRRLPELADIPINPKEIPSFA